MPAPDRFERMTAAKVSRVIRRSSRRYTAVLARKVPNEYTPRLAYPASLVFGIHLAGWRLCVVGGGLPVV